MHRAVTELEGTEDRRRGTRVVIVNLAHAITARRIKDGTRLLFESMLLDVAESLEDLFPECFKPGEEEDDDVQDSRG
jgi:hypothetical protein